MNSLSRLKTTTEPLAADGGSSPPLGHPEVRRARWGDPAGLPVSPRLLREVTTVHSSRGSETPRYLPAPWRSAQRAIVGRFPKRCASWALPALGLVLIPKCPFCLAAYVAVGPGLGLSLGEATVVRAGLIGACALFLLFLAIRQVHPVVRKWTSR